jgi:hypothetical protein
MGDSDNEARNVGRATDAMKCDIREVSKFDTFG